MNSNMLFFNILYWIILQIFIDLVTRSVKAGAFVSIGLAYLIGLINDVVFQFRGNYVIFGDVTVVRTALEVAGNYTYKPGKWFWISLGLFIFAAVITVLIKFPKHQKIHIKEALIRAGAVIVLTVGVIFSYRTGILYNRIFGVGWDYNKNIVYAGYLPYFLSNMNSIQKVTIDGYEASAADAAIARVPQKGIKKKVSSPNIIIIQNEAFSDLSVLYDIKTNKDYMPFIHSLSENTQKGFLNMSVPNGPTANSEFEVLTRSTLQFLPYGTVPYTQYIHSDLPSAVEVLKKQPVPYHTVSYHPYYSSGYSRTGVYKHMGFDEIIFEDRFNETFPTNEIIRSYLSDSADYRRVESFYEDFRKTSKEPWFCFNVTIQNHGGYTQKYDPSESNNIYVTNFEATDSVNDYLSLIKLSDDAFRDLVEYFKNCEEPTIIAMYGDHQPSFDQDALDVLEKHKTGSELYKYYVPYVIWANFDIEESDTLVDREHRGVQNTLSTNYFASTVFDLAGIGLSDYDRYLLDLHKRVPAITAVGIWDDKGNYYDSPESSPYAAELASYRMVQYNLLFDDRHRLVDRFIHSSQS
ncbi:MAG: LTA synthase family protein [Saccharofermentans sp.]|nr:LTA synthase family protein [Saccharofermentans sp.]